jgi:hypothetical protein
MVWEADGVVNRTFNAEFHSTGFWAPGITIGLEFQL